MNLNNLKSNLNEEIEGLKFIKPSIFKDDRGFFYETWNKEKFNNLLNKKVEFFQDNHSKSSFRVLRGLHYQLPPCPQGKLVRCIKGKVFDVAVDLRKSSRTFKQWTGVYLDDLNKFLFWIPEGFAHGFLTLSQEAEILYKATSPWEKSKERTILWNDIDLRINWPLKEFELKRPILSDKDNQGQSLKDAIKNNDIFL